MMEGAPGLGEEMPSSLAPEVGTATLRDRQEEPEEDGQGPSEDQSTEVDVSSMATDSCPAGASGNEVCVLLHFKTGVISPALGHPMLSMFHQHS